MLSNCAYKVRNKTVMVKLMCLPPWNNTSHTVITTLDNKFLQNFECDVTPYPSKPLPLYGFSFHHICWQQCGLNKTDHIPINCVRHCTKLVSCTLYYPAPFFKDNQLPPPLIFNYMHRNNNFLTFKIFHNNIS